MGPSRRFMAAPPPPGQPEEARSGGTVSLYRHRSGRRLRPARGTGAPPVGPSARDDGVPTVPCVRAGLACYLSGGGGRFNAERSREGPGISMRAPLSASDDPGHWTRPGIGPADIELALVSVSPWYRAHRLTLTAPGHWARPGKGPQTDIDLAPQSGWIGLRFVPWIGLDNVA